MTTDRTDYDDQGNKRSWVTKRSAAPVPIAKIHSDGYWTAMPGFKEPLNFASIEVYAAAPVAGLTWMQEVDPATFLHRVAAQLRADHGQWAHIADCLDALASGQTEPPVATPAPVADTFEQKNARNRRVQSRYDELMAEGKHGHYETMFRVVREEVEAARSALGREGSQP